MTVFAVVAAVMLDGRAPAVALALASAAWLTVALLGYVTAWLR